MGLQALFFTVASLSFVASAYAVWLFSRVRKLLQRHSVRSLLELSTEVSELRFGFESLAAQQKKLSARVGMREVRHRGEELREADDDSAPARGSREERLNKLREIARAKGFRL